MVELNRIRIRIRIQQAIQNNQLVIVGWTSIKLLCCLREYEHPPRAERKCGEPLMYLAARQTSPDRICKTLQPFISRELYKLCC